VKKNIQKLNNKITLHIMVFVWQHNGIIHILAVKASVQPWWPNKTIKLSLHVCGKTIHTEVLLQGPKYMKMENIYFQSWTSLLVVKQQVIFGFMLRQLWYQHFSATVLLTLGQGLLLHLLQHYAACLWLAPTESKIPIKLVHGLCHKICFITNATKASALTLTLIIRHICTIVKNDFWLHHVCPSAHLHRMILLLFDGFSYWYLMIFWRTVKKIQFSLKHHRNNRHFTWRKTYFLTISHSILLKTKNVSKKKFREIQKTHFKWKNFFF
jgi:hypothetical protein